MWVFTKHRDLLHFFFSFFSYNTWWVSMEKIEKNIVGIMVFWNILLQIVKENIFLVRCLPNTLVKLEQVFKNYYLIM